MVAGESKRTVEGCSNMTSTIGEGENNQCRAGRTNAKLILKAPYLFTLVHACQTEFFKIHLHVIFKEECPKKEEQKSTNDQNIN